MLWRSLDVAPLYTPLTPSSAIIVRRPCSAERYRTAATWPACRRDLTTLEKWVSKTEPQARYGTEGPTTYIYGYVTPVATVQSCGASSNHRIRVLFLTKWLTELRNSAKHEKIPVGKQRAHTPALATMAHEGILELLKNGVLKHRVHYEH